MSKINKWLLLSIVIMVMIFWFSHDTSSISLEKSSFFQPLFEWLFHEHTQFVVRKLAHFSIYAALGFCLFRAILPFGVRPSSCFWLTWIFCFLYACSDEIHQLFIAGRAGQFADVLLDSTGAGIGILVSLIFIKKWG